MTQKAFRAAPSAGLALSLLLGSAAFNASAAGPFPAATSVATPSGGNTNFVQLKQISGFTGQMAFSFSDGGYTPLGSSFNTLIRLRFTVDCPADYRIHEAGIRVRGSDVNNYDVELVSPGDVPFDQNTWEQALEQEPWKFDAVVAAGMDALDAAGNNGPVYVSLDKVLDSRTEFYGSCAPSQPSSGLPFIYYDSAEDNGHLRPMTRVRYALSHIAVARQRMPREAARHQVKQLRQPERLRHRERAIAPLKESPTAKRLRKAPDGCPYDCPPPARRSQLRN